MKILTKKKQEELMQTVTNIYLVCGDCIKTLAMLPGGADFIKAEKLLIDETMKIADGLEGMPGVMAIMKVDCRQREMQCKGEAPKLPLGIEFDADELITIDMAVRVFGDTWPERRALSGKFERALRKAAGGRIEIDVPEMSGECSDVKDKAEQRINEATNE